MAAPLLPSPPPFSPFLPPFQGGKNALTALCIAAVEINFHGVAIYFHIVAINFRIIESHFHAVEIGFTIYYNGVLLFF